MDQDLYPGRVFSKRYRLVSPIARGGMAEVFSAFDMTLRRKVAIKILRRDLSSDSGFAERFQVEAHAAGSLNHPNIVAVYDSGSEGEESYIVMELVEGKSLREMLQLGRVKPKEALKIIAEAAGALHYSHEKGIIHRDVKPGNIMVSKSGLVKVLDFGIARSAESAEAALTKTSTALGTAQYMSPEQAQGQPVDERSDVYALGCVLYEMLLGRPPFTGEAVAVAYQHVYENPAELGGLLPELDKRTALLAMKALEKKPEARYQGARALREDALAVLTGQKTQAEVAATPSEGIGERTIVAAIETTGPLLVKKSRKGVYALIGSILSLLLIGGGAWYWTENRTYSVPNVVGFSQEKAISTLQTEGFQVGDLRTVESSEPVGEVVNATPNAGAKAKRGADVDLDVSAGKSIISAPENFAAAARAGGVDLAWDKVPGAESYNIYQDGNIVNTTPDTTAAFELAPGVYTFAVSAVIKEQVGTQSARVRAEVTPITQPLLAPTNLQVSETSSKRIKVSWEGQEAMYRIYLNGKVAGDVSDEAWTSTSLSPGSSYTVSITSIREEQESAPSESAAITVSNVVAPTPRNLTANRDEEGNVLLTWEGSGASWNIYRNGDFLVSVDELSYLDAAPAGAQSYEVAGVNGSIESERIQVSAPAFTPPTPSPTAPTASPSPTVSVAPIQAPLASPTLTAPSVVVIP